MKRQKSFTLIELLVVMAIIGLLASIVMVSLKGARERAQLAKTASWARSVFAQLGADAVGIWNFNDCSATDLSAYGNHGTLYGGVGCTDGIPGFTGRALYFDGSNGYVQVSSVDSLKYRGKEMTIESWIFPASGETNSGRIVSKPWNGHGQYNYWVIYNSNYTISFQLFGATSYSITTVATAAREMWHHIVATVNSSGLMKIYINGTERASDTHNIVSWTPGSGDTNIPLAIGTLYPYGAGWAGNTSFSFNGTIDEVRIYNRALTAFEIQKHYVEGLKRHQGLVMDSDRD